MLEIDLPALHICSAGRLIPAGVFCSKMGMMINVGTLGTVVGGCGWLKVLLKRVLSGTIHLCSLVEIFDINGGGLLDVSVLMRLFTVDMSYVRVSVGILSL